MQVFFRSARKFVFGPQIGCKFYFGPPQVFFGPQNGKGKSFSGPRASLFSVQRSASLFFFGPYVPKKDLHGLWRAFAPQVLFRSAAGLFRSADLRICGPKTNLRRGPVRTEMQLTAVLRTEMQLTAVRAGRWLRARNVLPAPQYACGSLAARAECSPRAAIRVRIVGCARGMFSPRRNTRADRWLVMRGM